jgi:hypothetical protein
VTIKAAPLSKLATAKSEQPAVARGGVRSQDEKKATEGTEVSEEHRGNGEQAG